MLVENFPVEKIIPYDKNPRKITQAAIDAVAESLKAYGFNQPIVVDKNKVIIVGHTRFLAAKKLGLKEIPVHIALNLTDEQVTEYRIIDNKSGEHSKWDFDFLKEELGTLDTKAPVFSTNFSEYEFESIFEEEWASDHEKIDNLEEEDEVASSKIVVECLQSDKQAVIALVKKALEGFPDLTIK